MKRSLVVIAVLAVAAPSCGALLPVVFADTKVRTHTVAGAVREIVVTSASGDVDLVPSDAAVKVRETQHYVVKRPRLQQRVEDGVLTVDSACGDHLFVLTCYADLRVSVPAGVKVTVEADSGDVQARRVDVREAQLRSDSGDVGVQLAGRQQLVWARSDSGDIDVDAADARSVDAQTDSGDVTVDAGGQPRSISAQTDSGGVEVAVPTGDYAVDANSDSGDVEVDGLVRDDRALRSILAQTDSGDVTLRGR